MKINRLQSIAKANLHDKPKLPYTYTHARNATTCNPRCTRKLKQSSYASPKSRASTSELCKTTKNEDVGRAAGQNKRCHVVSWERHVALKLLNYCCSAHLEIAFDLPS